jgi:hypothetical protein
MAGSGDRGCCRCKVRLTINITGSELIKIHSIGVVISILGFALYRGVDFLSPTTGFHKSASLALGRAIGFKSVDKLGIGPGCLLFFLPVREG